MKINAYKLSDNVPPIRPGTPGRPWMGATEKKFAYLCLPMTIANRCGWEILNPSSFTVNWDGSNSTEGLEIRSESGAVCIAHSHFGHGILTLKIDYIFQTPPGVALIVGGAPNQLRDGACALTGIVETDWLPYPFTMNWKITRPSIDIRFEAEEPIAFITPVLLDELVAVEAELIDLSENGELESGYRAWSAERRRFNSARQDWTSAEAARGWAKHYLRGVSPDNVTRTTGVRNISLPHFGPKQRPTG